LCDLYEKELDSTNIFLYLSSFQIGYAAPAIAAAPALSYHPAPVARVAYAAPVAKVITALPLLRQVTEPRSQVILYIYIYIYVLNLQVAAPVAYAAPAVSYAAPAITKFATPALGLPAFGGLDYLH
jgi:hypothetical protein